MRSSIVTWLAIAAAATAQDVKILAPVEPPNARAESEERGEESASTGREDTGVIIQIGTEGPRRPSGRGGPGTIQDLLKVVSFLPGQAIFSDPSFGGITFPKPRHQRLESTNDWMPWIHRTSGELGVYLVAGQTQWIARKTDALSIRDAVFVAPAELESFSAAQPVIAVLAAAGDDSKELVAALRSAAPPAARIASIHGTKLVTVSGPAGELGCVTAALTNGLASPIEPATPALPAFVERAPESARRLSFQFNEVDGTPFIDFVSTCKEHGIEIEATPQDLSSRSIRILGRVVQRDSDLGALVEDVGRGLDRIVTGDGAKRRYWEHAEFVAARDAVDVAERFDFGATRVAWGALNSWRRRATRIRVDAWSSLTVDTVKSLFAPLLRDPLHDGEMIVNDRITSFVGPAFVVARNVEILNTVSDANPLTIYESGANPGDPLAGLSLVTRIIERLFTARPSQQVIVDASLDQLWFPSATGSRPATASAALDFVDRDLATHDAYLLRQSMTFRAVHEHWLHSAHNVPFVAPDELEGSTSARPVLILLAVRGIDPATWVERQGEALGDRTGVRFGVVSDTPLVVITARARDLGFVGAAIKSGEVIAANPPPPNSLAPIPGPGNAATRRILRFDKLVEIPLGVFVEYCAIEEMNITLNPLALRDRRIRLCGQFDLTPDDLTCLAHDIARALGLIVTEENGTTVLWEMEELFKQRISSAGTPSLDPRTPSPIHHPIGLADVATWRDRATLVTLELPLGPLSVAAAYNLLGQVIRDPMIETTRATSEDSVVISGPAFLVARAFDLVEAAKSLIAK
jgi:hypothetical protein